MRTKSIFAFAVRVVLVIPHPLSIKLLRDENEGVN